MGRHLQRGWMLYRLGRHAESLEEFGLARSEPADRGEAAAGMAFDNPLWFGVMALFVPCLMAWVVISALFTLVTSAITDVAFAVKKETRRLLTPAEKGAVPWQAAALAFFVVALPVGIAKNSGSAMLAGMTGIALLPTTRMVFRRLQLGIRGWYFHLARLTAASTAAILPASFLLPARILDPITSCTALLSVALALLTLCPRLLKVSETNGH
jgi:hypothetical protein